MSDYIRSFYILSKKGFCGHIVNKQCSYQGRDHECSVNLCPFIAKLKASKPAKPSVTKMDECNSEIMSRCEGCEDMYFNINKNGLCYNCETHDTDGNIHDIKPDFNFYPEQSSYYWQRKKV